MNDRTVSRASKFFEEIERAPDKIKFLDNLVTHPVVRESEFIDYKGVEKISDKNKIRELWSEVLSCFSNSEGGVVIWGIDAPKNLPKKLSLTADAQGLRQWLLETQHYVTEPPIQGVEVKAYPDSGPGFVVCYIPQSPFRPHQAIHPHRNYYMRSGDSCVRIPHGVLKALFIPAETAFLEILYQLRNAPKPDVRVATWIHNPSPLSAYDVAVHYVIPDGLMIPQADKFWEKTQTAYPGEAVFATRPIHPGEMITLINPVVGFVSAGPPQLTKSPLDFRFSISLRNQQPLHYKIVMKDTEIDLGKRMKAEICE